MKRRRKTTMMMRKMMTKVMTKTRMKTRMTMKRRMRRMTQDTCTQSPPQQASVLG